MPYIKHPLFVPPPHDTVLYRYMTLGKLLHTVQTGRLWFTSTRLMERHEGRLGAADREPQQYLAAYGADVAAMFYVNCWSEGPHESNAMWRLYVGEGEGVCIGSTVARFIDAVAPEAGEVLLGRVKYVDYATLLDPVQGSNVLSPYLHKRAVLAAEREIRAGVVRPEGNGLAVPVSVTLGTLVERLILQPGAQPWLLEAVAGVLERAGIRAPVEHSAIDDVPPAKRTEAELRAWLDAQRAAAIAASEQRKREPPPTAAGPEGAA